MSYYYSYTVTHPGLGKSRILKADTRNELQQKAEAQLRAWNSLYAQQKEAQARRMAKADKAAQVESAQNEAEFRTEEATRILTEIEKTLASSLKRKLAFSWDDKKNHFPYPTAQPQVTYLEFPPQPQPTDAAFVPHFGLLDKLVGPLHEKKIAEAEKHYQDAVVQWQETCAKIGRANDAMEVGYLDRIAQWKTAKHAYEDIQAKARATADLKLQRYQAGSSSEVTEYNTKILDQSVYPDFFDKSFDLDFHAVHRVLTIDYDLPAFTDFPKLESVKYVKARNTFTESHLSAKEATRRYSGFVYQICLRTIYEVFAADSAKVIQGIAFNGYVSTTNPATGNVERTCVLALNTTPTVFAPLNLARVDPEECFYSLGGRASEPLPKYRPVTPAQVQADPTIKAPEWITTLRQKLSQAGGPAAFRLSDLEQLLGTIPGNRANLADSRNLVSLLAEGGFSIEPDASLLAQSYRATDAVAVFVPIEAAELKASVTYQGAMAVLAMCGLVAIADGRLDAYEVERTHQCVGEAFKLSPTDNQRFDALMKALVINEDCLWRALPQVVSQMKPEFKEWAVEVAIYVGIKNALLEDSERGVLNRIFEAIALPLEVQTRIISKYVTATPEVAVVQADPQPVGEIIARRKGGLQLDMSRVAAIAQETMEVVAKLSVIMEDKEVPVEVPVATPPVAVPPLSALGALNPHYLPIYQELITQPSWSRADFNKVALKYDLMPVAVVDVINAWSDDVLGDFLLEGEDPITIHTELLPSPS